MSAAELGMAPGPVDPGRRIETVDMVRGFALFGVLLVNMYNFGASSEKPRPNRNEKSRQDLVSKKAPSDLLPSSPRQQNFESVRQRTKSLTQVYRCFEKK